MNAIISHGFAPSHKQRLDEVLSRQRADFHHELPVSVETRRDRLDRAIQVLLKHQDDFCQAMSEDFDGRPVLLSKLTDITSAVGALRHAKKHLASWMKPERRKVDFPLNLLGARARVEFQPKGVVGIISPWNYPVNLAMAPMAGALAAGNRVMLKPSEFTPATSALLKSALAEVFDETEVAVFNGGIELGKAFAALPLDHLVFTGATAVGREVLAAAAPNLTPVTLELGGKSPTVVGASADIEQAAERIVLGKMMNAGQTCLAPDYLLVQEGIRDTMVEALIAAAQRIYPDVCGNDHYTSLVSERHAHRLRDLRREAERAGAEIRAGQTCGEDRRFPFTLVLDPADELAIMQEEIFGPLLPVKTWKTLDDVVGFINARPRPLGLYYFGSDTREQRELLDRTISGGVTLNDVIYHVTAEDLPLGGVGASGMGSYHGQDGFRTFSHARAVYTQSSLNLARMAGLIPPYGKKLERMIRQQLKR
ncbi:MAG: coniferyl aldehyde dehydrogenase [Xanthomonadales bacterium]|nr:coniferyl aldehyde dehydrogenase [Xanthomonadales bacterium]